MTNTRKKSVYLYPFSSRGEDFSSNPYMSNLAQSLQQKVELVNFNAPSASGVFHILAYFRKFDILYLNWIENLPDRKGGSLQSLVFVFIVFLCRLTGKKVVWTMHNKISHTKSNFFLKKRLFKFLLEYASHVITHSAEGIAYAVRITGKARHTIHYVPHPFSGQCTPMLSVNEKEYDILIWGSMAEYKGVDRFLAYLKDSGIQNDFRILIIGRFPDPGYEKKVRNLAGTRTIIDARFADNEELISLISRSRLVLFTYHDDSVLSSGALMDSLCYGGRIAGPAAGAFHDLSVEGLISVYHHFDEIPWLLSRANQSVQTEQDLRRSLFIRENTWDTFTGKLGKIAVLK